MCLLLLHKKEEKKKTKLLTFKEFQSAWLSNPHWFWMAVVNDWQFNIYKSRTLYEAWDLYKRATENFELIVAHFRMWTSWGYSLDLIHPFNLNKDTYLFHNWVMQIEELTPFDSDTSSLSKIIFEWKYNNKQIFNYVPRLLEAIWTWDKFIIINNKWHYKIVNEKGGSWIDNSWFSNSSYKSYKYIKGWYTSIYDM